MLAGDLIDLGDPEPGSSGARGSNTQRENISLSPPSTSPAAAMDLDCGEKPPNLGNLYLQCKTAREATMTINCTSFGAGLTFTSGEAKPARIGNLDMVGDTDVEKTFHGARICKGSKVVNECISVSFDP
jgi:hypothetical protein